MFPWFYPWFFSNVFVPWFPHPYISHIADTGPHRCRHRQLQRARPVPQLRVFPSFVQQQQQLLVGSEVMNPGGPRKTIVTILQTSPKNRPKSGGWTGCLLMFVETWRFCSTSSQIGWTSQSMSAWEHGNVSSCQWFGWRICGHRIDLHPQLNGGSS